MRAIKVQEYSGPRPNWKLVAYHYIMLGDCMNDDSYKEIRAYSAFFENGKRIKKRLNSSKNFSVRDPSDYDYYSRDYKIPEFRHLSIFDFFEHIGYDKKRKKFLK